MSQVAICPTITEYDPHAYRQRMEQLETFATHVHIDLMDGQLAPTVSPDLTKIWWPDQLTADIHLMYQQPMDSLEQLVRLKPRLVIIHYEADVNHAHFATHLRENNIKAGLALLQATPAEAVYSILNCFDHVLIFSGDLGHHKGQADLSLLDKIHQLREQQPNIEIGWDGGVNDQNAKQLAEGGVDVLNVGGFIASAEAPKEAYAKLEAVIKSL